MLGVIDAWQRDRVVSVHLFHNRRRAGTGTHPVAQRLLPVDLHGCAAWRRALAVRVLPTFTMNRDRLFAALVRQYSSSACFGPARNHRPPSTPAG